jgi:hypothetical protein
MNNMLILFHMGLPREPRQFEQIMRGACAGCKQVLMVQYLAHCLISTPIYSL